MLLVQSRVKPAIERWAKGYVLDLGQDLDMGFSTVGENPAVRDVTAERSRITEGQRLVFRLRANTTKKIDTKSGADGVRKQGRRVPVRGDEERTRWLSRRAEAGGFALETGNVRTIEIAAVTARGGDGVTLAGAMFEGVLVVRDAERFRETLAAGIGPAKAYGFGLLSIAPPR